jgi:protein involved in polysaccharide export with SLBB domain
MGLMRKLIIAGYLLMVSGCCLSPTHWAIRRLAPPEVIAWANRPIEVGEELWICNANHVVTTEETRHVVGSDGAVQLPSLGPVTIGGLRPAEAEEMIAKRFTSGGFYRHAAVKIVRKQKDPANKQVQPIAGKPGSG